MNPARVNVFEEWESRKRPLAAHFKDPAYAGMRDQYRPVFRPDRRDQRQVPASMPKARFIMRKEQATEAF